MNYCPVPACHKFIPDDIYLCGMCWKHIPAEVRIEYLEAKRGSPIIFDQVKKKILAIMARCKKERWAGSTYKNKGGRV